MCRLVTAASLNCTVAPLRTIRPNRCRHSSLQAEHLLYRQAGTGPASRQTLPGPGDLNVTHDNAIIIER